MKKRLLGLAALAFASAATLGSAEQGEGLGPDGPFACLFNDLSPENRRTAAVELAQDAPEAGSNAAQSLATAIDTLRAAAPRCVESERWTEKQRLMAFCYAHSQLTREGMRHVYRARNVDLTELETVAQAVATGPPGTRPPSADALAAGLQRQGMTEDESLDVVLRYAISAGIADGLKRSFADPSFQGC